MTDRKKPSAESWLTVALVAVLAGYPLSFGPACWLSSRTDLGAGSLSFIYRPLLWAMGRNVAAYSAFDRYSRLGAQEGWRWWLDENSDNWEWRLPDSIENVIYPD